MRVMVEERRRLETALVVSAVVHVVAAIWLGTQRVPALPMGHPPLTLIPVSLVGRVGGGGGERGPDPAPVAAPAPAPPPPVAAAPRPAPARTAVTAPPQSDAPAVPSLPATTGESAAAIGNGGPGATGTAARAGGGDGTGGDGTGGARVAYGSNPKPPYPISALRLRIEGTVLLAVTVAPDGHASAVRVAQSSGNGALDDSALTTVRERWRFVPARAAGVPVEGNVEVPIRFRLTDDEG